MEFYFKLYNGRKYVFKSYLKAKRFYESNDLEVKETNFVYEFEQNLFWQVEHYQSTTIAR